MSKFIENLPERCKKCIYFKDVLIAYLIDELGITEAQVKKTLSDAGVDDAESSGEPLEDCPIECLKKMS